MIVIRPREELRPYVRYYWVLKCNEPFCTLTFPIGCTQMIFHRRSPLVIPELDQQQSKFTISGQVNFPAHIQSDGDVEMVVAVFYPHTIGVFIATPPSSFYNREISGYDLENRCLNEVARKIFECDDCLACIDVLESWMMSCLVSSLNVDRVGHSLALMMKDPSISVMSLAGESCLSRKQFERVFRATVGMNPKEYLRVVRFQKALWLMQGGEENYAYVATDCGYADQSHFIREFRDMSGKTPLMLRQAGTLYSDLYSNPSECPFCSIC